MNDRLKKLIIFSMLGLILIMIAFSLAIYFLFYRTGTAKIKVYPTDSSFSINGKTYKGSQDINLPSGTYNVTFNRDGFAPTTETIQVDGGASKDVTVTQEPASGYSYDTELNAEDKAQAAQDLQSDLEAARFKAAFPISDYLPYGGDGYYIDFKANSETDLNPTVIISVFPNNENTASKLVSDARAWITSKGVDPNTLNMSTSIIQSGSEGE